MWTDVDATTPNNWLDDRYWLQKAYHEWRVPLLINSNWWLLFTNDPSLQPAAASQPAPLPKASSQGGALIGGLADTFAQARELAAPAAAAPPAEGEAEVELPAWNTEALLGARPFENMELGVRRAAWLSWRLAEFKLRLDR